MYYSEYLRNKKLAAAKIVSPPRGRSSGLQTQILRYKSSTVQGVQSDGQSLMRSSEGVLGAKGHAAVCCADTIKEPTVIQGCCDIVTAKWVAVGLDTNGTISYSLDGNTWVTTGGGGFYFGIGVTGIVYGNRWVAAGFLDLAGIQYSDDGITWQPGTGSIVDNSFAGFGVAYNGDIWVTVGFSFNSNSNNNIAWSPDGITWEDSSGEFVGGNLPGVGFGVAYGNNTWVAVGADISGHCIKYSSDGKSWYDANGVFTGGGGSYFPSVGYGVGYGKDASGQPLWVAVGLDFSGNSIKYSPDGQHWSDASSSFPGGLNSLGVGFGVGYGDNMWVAVGFDGDNSGNNILYSYDGRTWDIANGSFGLGTSGITGGPGTGYSVSYFNEWIAVGEDASGQNLLRSPDGINWTADTSPLNISVRGIAYNPNGGAETKEVKFPRGFYGPPRPDCPPVNGGPVIQPCCSAN